MKDDPQGTAKAFGEGIDHARKLLVEGLLGQARAYLQLDKKPAAVKCVGEALMVLNMDTWKPGKVDLQLMLHQEDKAGRGGNFQREIEELLEEIGDPTNQEVTKV